MHTTQIRGNECHCLCCRCNAFIYSTLLHCFLAAKDMWIYVEDQDMVNMETELSENLRCLFVYISKLPLIVQMSSSVFSVLEIKLYITKARESQAYMCLRSRTQFTTIYYVSNEHFISFCLENLIFPTASKS